MSSYQATPPGPNPAGASDGRVCAHVEVFPSAPTKTGPTSRRRPATGKPKR